MRANYHPHRRADRRLQDAVSQVQPSGICITPAMGSAGVQNISVPEHEYSGEIITSFTIPNVRRLIATYDPDLTVAKVAMLAA